MTAKQKANRERFKKVVAEAKKLRQKNPKLTQAQAVARAWAISYGKKAAAKKKKVGATKIIQKGESKNAKVTKVLQQTRTKKGQFKGYKRIGAVKKSKYEIGDKVYSYQNKNYLAEIVNKVFVPWMNINIPDKKDKYIYKLKLKEGLSNWIDEKSLSKRKQIGATSVKAKKSKKTSEMHTDTKSHNVNIRVVSGIGATKFYL